MFPMKKKPHNKYDLNTLMPTSPTARLPHPVRPDLTMCTTKPHPTARQTVSSSDLPTGGVRTKNCAHDCIASYRPWLSARYLLFPFVLFSVIASNTT